MASKAAPSNLLTPWPDREGSLRPGETVRATLDYVCWVAEQMLTVGFHAGSRRDEWRRRVHTAYAALFRPVLPGHGDPYPPDVPPARNPGIWPDVPAAMIPGMTLRHQLTVVRMLCHQIRTRDWLHARPSETDEWERRLSKAFAALDHGEALQMPDDARTAPSAEVLAAALAETEARADKARRRTEQLKKQMARMRRKRAEAKNAPKKVSSRRNVIIKAVASKKKAAPKKAAAKPKKAAAKKTASKKKAAPKKAAAKPKKAAAKKTASKKATAKPKKAAAKKTASKRKAPAGKARPKKTASKKKAAKKKPAK